MVSYYSRNANPKGIKIDNYGKMILEVTEEGKQYTETEILQLVLDSHSDTPIRSLRKSFRELKSYEIISKIQNRQKTIFHGNATTVREDVRSTFSKIFQ